MILAITAVSALIPSILLAWYFYSRDLQREPARVVWATFGLGVLSIIPALLIDWPIDALFVQRLTNPLAIGGAEAFSVAAIPEELCKFSVLYWYARRRRCFDEPMDGIVYGAIASLGFATLENVLYCLQGNLFTALFRAFTAVPGHAFWGAIMGYYVGIAHFSPKAERSKWLVRALAWPMLLHGLYDAPLLAIKTFVERKIEPTGAAVPILIVGVLVSLTMVVLSWVQGIRLTRRMRRAQALALASPGPIQQTGAAVHPSALGSAGWPTTPAPPAVPANIMALAAIWPRDASGSIIADNGAAASEAPKASAPLGWLFLLFGGLLANVGALILIGAIISLVTRSGANAGAIVAAAIFFGVIPMGAGFWLFSAGLRRLPKPGPLPAPLPMAP